MGSGEMVALCPSASRTNNAAEGVEGSRGDSEAPITRPLEQWERQAFSGNSLRGGCCYG